MENEYEKFVGKEYINLGSCSPDLTAVITRVNEDGTFESKCNCCGFPLLNLAQLTKGIFPAEKISELEFVN